MTTIGSDAVLWLVLMLPLSDPLTYDTDICELNTIVSSDGTPQVSFYVWWVWEFHEDYGYDYYVRAWRNADCVPYPVKNTQEWYDNKIDKQIRVRHRVFRKVKSNYDREIADRDRLPENLRTSF